MTETTFGQVAEEAKKGGGGLPNGLYDFVVEAASPTFTSNKNKSGVILTLKVLTGPEAGRGGRDALYFSFESPTAMDIVLGNLTVLGADTAFLNTLGTFDPDDHARLEQICTAIAFHVVGAQFSGKIIVKGGYSNIAGRYQPYAGGAPVAGAIPAAGQVPAPVAVPTAAPPAAAAPAPAPAPAAPAPAAPAPAPAQAPAVAATPAAPAPVASTVAPSSEPPAPVTQQPGEAPPF